MQRLWISLPMGALLFLSTSLWAENRSCEFTPGVAVPCTVVDLGEAQADDSGLPEIAPETLIEDSKFVLEELAQGTSPLHLQVLNHRDWASVDRHILGNMYKQYVGHKMGELLNYRAAQIEQALRKKYGLENADRSAVLEAAALHYKLPLIDVPEAGKSAGPVDLSKLDLNKLLGNGK